MFNRKLLVRADLFSPTGYPHNTLTTNTDTDTIIMTEPNVTIQIVQLPQASTQYSYEVAPQNDDTVVKEAAAAPSPLIETATNKRDHLAPPLPPFLNAIDSFRRRYILPFSNPPIAALPDTGLGELILYIIWFGVNALIVIILVVEFATAGDVTSQQNAATTLGTIGSIDLVFILFPIAQNSIWLYIFGVSFERAVKYHIWMALTAIFVLTLHGVLMWISYALHTEPNDGYGGGGSWSSQAFDGPLQLNGSGFGAMAALLVIGAMAIEPIRRYCWQIFIRTHVILFLAFLVFATAHATVIAYFIPALILWAIDIYCRYRSASAKAKLISIQLLPSGEMSIEFTKDKFTYKAGQWVYLCVPAIDPTQWHPFSLSSSPHQTRLFLHARVLGDWTRQLLKYATITEINNNNNNILPNIYIDGPYGSSNYPVENYEYVTLVAGGIGITPLQSVLNQLLYINEINQNKTKTQTEKNLSLLLMKKIYFYWSIRDTRMITSLNNEFFTNIQREGITIIPSIVDMRIYVTQQQNKDVTRNSIKEAIVLEHFNNFILNERMNIKNLMENIKKSILHTPIIHEEDGLIKPVTQLGNPSLSPTASSPAIQPVVAEESLPESSTSASASSGPTRVLVLCCGPASLMKEVQHICALISDDQVRLDVHTETFEL